jgi:hypothetical protein
VFVIQNGGNSPALNGRAHLKTLYWPYVSPYMTYSMQGTYFKENLQLHILPPFPVPDGMRSSSHKVARLFRTPNSLATIGALS